MSESTNESIIGKFFGVLGFKVDESGVNKFEDELKKIKHVAEAILAVPLFERIASFVEHSISSAAKVHDLGDTIEMSAERISALGSVASSVGVNFESMESSIMGVYRATGQVAMGIGRNVHLIQTLGIKAKDSNGKVRDVENVMADLAEKFSKMDRAKVIAAASRLGISTNLALRMRELGGEGWRKEVTKSSKGGILSNADYKRAFDTEIAFAKFHDTIKKLTTLIAIQFAPWVQKATKAVTEWVTANKVEIINKVKQATQNLTAVFLKLWTASSKVIDTFGTIYKFFNENKVAAASFRTVIAGLVAIKLGGWLMEVAHGMKMTLTTLTQIPKFAGIIALLIAGIALLVEDWMGFQEGEESVLGDLRDKWPAAFDVINASIKYLADAMNEVVEVARVLGLIGPKKAEVGSMAWVAEQDKKPPLAPSKDYAPYMKAKGQIEAGTHPEQIAAGQKSAGVAADIQNKFDNVGKAPKSWTDWFGSSLFKNPLAEMNQTGEALKALQESARVQAMTQQAIGDGKGPLVNVYNTGTKVEIKADTDERARMAGESVKDALLEKSKVRQYQQRNF